MPMSEYVRRMRDAIGTDLLLVPSVAVLLRDDDARLLLVRHADHGQWGLLGGAIDPDESPRHAAARESREEIGVDVVVGDVVGALGGSAYEVEYANGDRTAYVTIVYDGRVAGGEMRPDGVEVTEIGWFDDAELDGADLHFFARAALVELGLIKGLAGPVAPGDAATSPR